MLILTLTLFGSLNADLNSDVGRLLNSTCKNLTANMKESNYSQVAGWWYLQYTSLVLIDQDLKCIAYNMTEDNGFLYFTRYSTIIR